MKRYLLFGDCSYYPCGGFYDFRGDFDSVGEALDHLKKIGEDDSILDWFQIIDQEERICVKYSGSTCYGNGDPFDFIKSRDQLFF